jgi:hypothetical protein
MIVAGLVSLVVITPCAAMACNSEQAIGLARRCVVANDTADNGAKSLYCANAAQEYGLCAAENTGKVHYGFVAIEARMLSLAGFANLEGVPYIGKQQLQSAKVLARSVLASRTAEPKVRRIARNTLDDILKAHR